MDHAFSGMDGHERFVVALRLAGHAAQRSGGIPHVLPRGKKQAYRESFLGIDLNLPLPSPDSADLVGENLIVLYPLSGLNQHKGQFQPAECLGCEFE